MQIDKMQKAADSSQSSCQATNAAHASASKIKEVPLAKPESSIERHQAVVSQLDSDIEGHQAVVVGDESCIEQYQAAIVDFESRIRQHRAMIVRLQKSVAYHQAESDKCQSLKESIDKTFEDYNVAIEKANLELEATNRKYAAVLTDFPHQD